MREGTELLEPARRKDVFEFLLERGVPFTACVLLLRDRRKLAEMLMDLR